MKWTPKLLQEKVMAIVEAENKGLNTTFIIELPAGSYFYRDFYYTYRYQGVENAQPPKVTDKYILDTPAKIRWNCFTQFGISGYSNFQYHKNNENKEERRYWNNWQTIRLDWKHIIDQPEILKMLVEWLEKKTPNFTVIKNKGVITFVNNKTKEKLHCDLANQKFSRSYLKGKDREIRYPAQYFKYVSGRALINTLNDPNATTFNTLVDLVAQNYRNCRNFGTFLVKMFDHQHLEQYISAGVEFDFNTPFSYSQFSKDIRTKINEHKIRYDANIGSLFCSDLDIGRAVFAQIKDCKGFVAMTQLLCHNIQALNTLVNHYNYDLKRLFEYCRKRKWKSGAYNQYWGYRGREQDNENPEDKVIQAGHYLSTYNYDIVNYLRDYARMALAVYGNAYEKYPENLVEAHNTADRIYRERQVEIDAKAFEETIDKSLEWKNKEFAVIYPKTANDVVEEGKKLRHCVGSYVHSVIRGETKILFLRVKEDIDKPFITLEIQGGNIRQARGVGNSAPTYDARMALRDFAKEKKLLYRG